MCAKWSETSIPMVHLHPRAAELLVTSQPGKGMTNSCRQMDAWWGVGSVYAIHHRQMETLKSGQGESVDDILFGTTIISRSFRIISLDQSVAPRDKCASVSDIASWASEASKDVSRTERPYPASGIPTATSRRSPSHHAAARPLL
jgi:hypothetical protein